jgi:hypothetical protein
VRKCGCRCNGCINHRDVLITFTELKRYLTSLPIMVTPTFREPLLLYIPATQRTTSDVVVIERDAHVIAQEKIDPPCPGGSS